jgi:SAM-dependent methyltransferase
MTVDLQGLPVFFETYEPEQPTQFDFDLDELAKADALERSVIKGVCNVSGAETEFHLASDNFREDLVAHTSSTINRHRQAVCALSLSIFAHPHATLAEIAAHVNRERLKVYLAETRSPLFCFLRDRLEPELFVCSEYFGAAHASGEMVGNVLHQDLQRTSFADETFDIVLTFEVFEHIPDAVAAEREVVRILKAGGIYCFTVPLTPDGEHDLVLAELGANGELRHFAEPQYHGDPLRPDEGILVFRIFSHRDLKRRFEGLGCDFKTYRLWSKALGILGSNGWVHVVRKAATIGETDAGDADAGGAFFVAAMGAGRGPDVAQQLAHMRAQLANAQAQLLDAEPDCNDVRERLAKQEASIVGLQAGWAAAQKQLKTMQARVAQTEDALVWSQTSRSGRLLATLRNVGHASRLAQLTERLRRTLLRPVFHGAIEAPDVGSPSGAGELEVVGWACSTGASITRVEAFLGGVYLGQLNYGLEREDVAANLPPGSSPSCGYAARFKLQRVRAGRQTLLVRVYDERGRRHSYTRSLVFDSSDGANA